MKLRPLHDRVIVKREDEEKTTAGGIVLPNSATEKPSQGPVIAVGDGKILNDGSKSAMNVKAGDKILFGKYSGSEVKIDGVEYIIMREDEIFAVIEK